MVKLKCDPFKVRSSMLMMLFLLSLVKIDHISKLFKDDMMLSIVK